MAGPCRGHQHYSTEQQKSRSTIRKLYGDKTTPPAISEVTLNQAVSQLEVSRKAQDKRTTSFHHHPRESAEHVHTDQARHT